MPTRPPDPAPTPDVIPAMTILTVVSGETHEPVVGAGVRVVNQTYRTDSGGRAVLLSPVETASLMEVEAPNFFLRQTRLRREETTLTLWPATSPTGLSEHITYAITYGTNQQNPLRRLASATVSLAPSGDLQGDPLAMRSLQDAAEVMTRATQGAITLAIGEGTAPGVTVRAIVDPSSSGAGVTLETRGAEIVGATIGFRAARNAQVVGVVLHELGHVFGFAHSPDGSIDIMGPGPDDKRDFSSREKLLMALALQRRPGNRFPDNDQSLRVTTTAGREFVICVP